MPLIQLHSFTNLSPPLISLAFARQLFDFGMIATGNHNFEKFAALCNAPGEAKGTSCQRVAKLATPTRAYRLKVCTTWLPPGGSCQTALRNRLTDEGRRTVGQEMQLDERCMFQIVPFNREIQNF